MQRDTNFSARKLCYYAMVSAILIFLPMQTAIDSVKAAPPTVEMVLNAHFDRVAGPETGDAAFFPDTQSDWYDHSVSMPTVEFDGKMYRMWFVGHTITSAPEIPYGSYEQIGLATSDDGMHWKIANQGQPVIKIGVPGTFDDAGLAHPFALRVGDQYMLWYGGIDGRTGEDVGVNPPHVRVEQIGLATSPDGIHWTRANGGKPVLKIGPPGSIDSIQVTGCHVIRRDDEFVMWYGAYNGSHTIGLASSPDGIHWTKENQGRSITGLSGTEKLGPSIHFDGRRYLMLYNTDLASSGGAKGLWTTFAATSLDGLHWEPALDHHPLLGPAPPGNFGSADGKKGNNHAVHPTKMIFVGNSVCVWYGAEGNEPVKGLSWAHNAIGLMKGKIQP